MRTLLISLILCVSLANSALADYLQARYGVLENEDEEKYFLMEKPVGENWALGLKWVDQGKFSLFDCSLGYKLNQNFQLGVHYVENSFDRLNCYPSFRAMSGWENIFLIGEVSQIRDKTDLWVKISFDLNSDWYWAVESWCVTDSQGSVFSFRPLKLGYRGEKISPFVMYERRFGNNLDGNNFYVGSEFNF